MYLRHRALGNNLQLIRSKSGFTQEELAEAVGISTSFYANLERGNKGVSVLVLYDIAQFLGITVDYLLYKEHADARIRNIEALLREKPESFIIAIEKMIRLCIEKFENRA
jgi:transcriptional regulator with XRE-family HTH domain